MTEAQKQKCMPALVLTVICLVVALALAAVNLLTAPIVEENSRQKQLASLREVMPSAADFTPEEGLTLPDTITAVYRETEGRGYVLLAETSSSYTGSEPLAFTIGIGADGRITGICLTSYSESKDFGKSTYPETYVGKDETLDGTGLVAGVTYSSTAFRNAVKDAFSVLRDNRLLDTEGGTEQA